jgi:hypothetical protein
MRYQMRATYSDMIRGASVAVEVEPATADVQFPRAPTLLTPTTQEPSVSARG